MPNTVAEPEAQEEKRELGAMSLLQHLEELRKRIIHSAVAIVVCFGLGWYYHERIFTLMRRPITDALTLHHWDPSLIYTNPTDPFNLYLKIALIAAIFFASPFILYQVWLFISPGLYSNEKRYVIPFLLFSVGLFLAGGLFGYKVVYPKALDFLIGFGGDLRPLITVTEYTSLFLTIVLSLGIIFELPIVIGFASLMGVVDAKFLMRHLRGAVFLAFVLAALITPTPDIMSVTIFAEPIIGLYLASVAVAWFVHPSRRKAKK